MIRRTYGVLLKGALGALLLYALPAAAGGSELAPEKKAFNKALRSTLPSGGTSDGVAGGKLGTGRMRSANQVASKILEKSMRSRRLKLGGKRGGDGQEV